MGICLGYATVPWLMKVNTLCFGRSFVFPMLIHEEGNLASVLPHICTPVNKEVMDYSLKVLTHSNQLKNVQFN